MGGVDNACAKDKVGADVPNRALDRGGIHARKRIVGLGKELLHFPRDVQRRVESDYAHVRQASEVHGIDQAVFHVPALVEILGIDAYRNQGG